jgi:hypothetical protein
MTQFISLTLTTDHEKFDQLVDLEIRSIFLLDRLGFGVYCILHYRGGRLSTADSHLYNVFDAFLDCLENQIFDFRFFQVQLHLQSGSYVSVGEILTTPPDVKYNVRCSYAQNRVPAVIRLDVIHKRHTRHTHTQSRR